MVHKSLNVVVLGVGRSVVECLRGKVGVVGKAVRARVRGSTVFWAY
jgi:hypothetical protein